MVRSRLLTDEAGNRLVEPHDPALLQDDLVCQQQVLVEQLTVLLQELLTLAILVFSICHPIHFKVLPQCLLCLFNPVEPLRHGIVAVFSLNGLV